jgi:2-keto-4-pentenoate hydratase
MVNEGLVIGPQIAGPQDLDLRHLAARLEVDGKVEVDTTAALAMGSVAAVVAGLVRLAVARRGGIAADTWVTTGSWTGMRFFAPPVRVRGSLAGRHAVEVDLA